MKQIIGITGKIGSGKSYCTSQLSLILQSKKISHKVVDVDIVRHELLDLNTNLKEQYKTAYSSKEKMHEFKSAFNPFLKDMLYKIIKSASEDIVLLEWALLVEDDMLDLIDKLIIVKCSEKVRKQRVSDLKLLSQRLKFQIEDGERISAIKKIKKPYFLFSSTKNPDIKEYEKLLSSALQENYDFCLFKIPQNGARALWEITNTCNYHCSYCIFCSNPVVDKNELSYDEVIKAIDGLKRNGFTYIKFTGGEPFVRKDMIQILSYAKSLGFDLDISTNGSLLTKETAKSLAELSTNGSLLTKETAKSLAELKLNFVHVSLDGFDKFSHEIVRGENTFDRTINGIKLLSEFSVKTRIGTVIHKGNENCLEKIVLLSKSLGTDEIIFSFMEAIGRLNQKSELLSTKKICEVENELSTLKQKYMNQIKVSYSFTRNKTSLHACSKCPALKKFVYIDNLGRISPCTWIVDKNPESRSKLTLKNATFEEVMEDDSLKTFMGKSKFFKSGICPVRTRK
ncbi:MAG: dephospho-CoA kinase [Clostridia bacterium]